MADSSYGQVAAVQRAVDQANQALTDLQMRQVQLQQVVDHVATTQDVTRSELQELRSLFDDFLIRDQLNHNLQLAQTEIVAVRQELETKYGHYGEVRRLATGTLQGMDAGIVKQETLQAIAEELMVTTPGYWLAPALVALAAWIRDDEALAKRALAEALRRDNDKTSLFFALVLRRQLRNHATARWLGQYVSRQDPSRLSQEFTVVVDAAATGALGSEARPLVMENLHEWYERLGQDPAVVAAQVGRWRQLIDGMRGPVPQNWRGRPLSSHEVIVNSIAATTTRTGLRVAAELDTDSYETGVRVSDGQMAALPLARHEWHGDWNYSLRPSPTRRFRSPHRIRSTSPAQPRHGLAVPHHGDRADRPGVGCVDHLDHHAAPSAAGSRAGQTTRTPSPKDPLRGRTSSRPHPRRPGTGYRPAPPPRPAPGRRRRPVQRPPRNHQPAHPRHPRPARPGGSHHRARPATTGHPRRPLQPRQGRRHHRPDTNHDSESMICKP